MKLWTVEDGRYGGGWLWMGAGGGGGQIFDHFVWTASMYTP